MMIEHERKLWISLLEESRKKKKWSKELCDLAGRFAGGEAYCPRCLLSLFFLENRAALEKEEYSWGFFSCLSPEGLEGGCEGFEDFGFFLAPPCFLMGLFGESMRWLSLSDCAHTSSKQAKALQKAIEEDEKENIVYWCARVIKWLEGKRPRKARGKAVSRSSSPRAERGKTRDRKKPRKRREKTRAAAERRKTAAGTAGKNKR